MRTGWWTDILRKGMGKRMISKKEYLKAVRKRPLCLFLPMFQSNLLRWIPDERYLKMEYRVIMGKKLHLDPPITFNEKIQWLKLHDRKQIYRELADKYKNRKFVEEYIGKGYLIPLLGVWDRAQDIDFDILPEQFVLKSTHGYGGMILCYEKQKLNTRLVRKKLNQVLVTDFYPRGREWSYGGASPKIIAEKLIDDGGGERPADYKFFCMNGEVRCVCLSRSLGDKKGCVSFFRPDGERMPFKRVDYPDYPGKNPLPGSFQEMKEAAQTLAKASQAAFIRVDFYEMRGKVYFSEFTFYPCGGTAFLDPPEYDEALGDLLKI